MTSPNTADALLQALPEQNLNNLLEALKMAVKQNECDMVMTGE